MIIRKQATFRLFDGGSIIVHQDISDRNTMSARLRPSGGAWPEDMSKGAVPTAGVHPQRKPRVQDGAGCCAAMCVQLLCVVLFPEQKAPSRVFALVCAASGGAGVGMPWEL